MDHKSQQEKACICNKQKVVVQEAHMLCRKQNRIRYKNCTTTALQQHYRLTLIMMTLAACITQPEARHVHRVHTIYDPAAAHAPAASAAAADVSLIESLPDTWQANPLFGLEDDAYSNSKSNNNNDNNNNNNYSDEFIDSYSPSESLDEYSSSGSSSNTDLDINNSSHMDEIYDEIAHAAAAAAMREVRAQRKRLGLRRRRQSNALHYFTRVHNDKTSLAWENTCSGTYQPVPQEHGSLGKHLKKLRRNVRKAYLSITDKPNKAIDIKDMKLWEMHKSTYKFLPKITKNDNVCLSRWYSDMQTYIASFEALGRAHYKYEKSYHLPTEAITHELHDLLVNARSVLCEIQKTINMSYPENARSDHLPAITGSDEMHTRLQFKTKFHANVADLQIEAADLVFVKFRYLHYVSRMWAVLYKNIQDKNITNCGSNTQNLATHLADDEYHLIDAMSMTSGSASAEHKTATHTNRRRSRKQSAAAAAAMRRS